MRAYELHGVNDLRREDIEKPEIPIRLGSGAGKGIRNLQLRYSADFHKRNIPFPTIPGHEFQAWLPHTARVCRKSELETGRHFPADPMPHLPAVPAEKI